MEQWVNCWAAQVGIMLEVQFCPTLSRLHCTQSFVMAVHQLSMTKILLKGQSQVCYPYSHHLTHFKFSPLSVLLVLNVFVPPKCSIDSKLLPFSGSKKQGSSQKDLITKAATLPPPPPPPAEEHPVVKSLQLMYGSTSESDSEDEKPHKDRKNKTAKAEPKVAGPAPSTIPLPPAPPDNRGDRGKEDRHDRGREDRAERKERKEKHKSKKKKKEKSKKKDREKREEPAG